MLKMKMKTLLAESAGGVVYRIGVKELEIVLGFRAKAKTWGLPKGTPKGAEDIRETALREVAEETGLQVEIVAPLGDIDYWFVAGGTRYHKTVHYFLMQTLGGDVSLHDYEHDRVEWFEVETALKTITFDNEKAIILKARNYLEKSAKGAKEPNPC